MVLFVQFTFLFKITAVQQVTVVSSDGPIQWSGLGNAGETNWFLIQKELEPEALAAVVKNEDQVSGVRHNLAGAERPAMLLTEVSGGQWRLIMEEAHERQEGEKGLSMSHLHRHSLSHMTKPE